MSRRPPFRLLAAAALAAALAAASGARAQAPLTRVDDDTRVASVDFAFEGTETLLVEDLLLEVATAAPPSGIGALVAGLLGGGGDDGVYPFSPVELARDAVRLTRHYEANGFPFAEVGYEVELDTADNAVDVTFLIEEGPPRLLEEVTFAGPGQADVATVLAPEIRDAWRTFVARIGLRSGTRLDDAGRLGLRTQTVGWLRNRGYAFADAGAEAFADETGLRADVRVKVNVGPRATVDTIRVEGAVSLDEAVVRRELPFESGDLFDASGLAEGQREIFGLGLFELALVDVAEGQARSDTTINVAVRVRRGPSRVLNGFAGYFSEGGITLRGQFSHRNAFGGARTLALGTEARTGIGDVGSASVNGGPIRDYRASVTFRQPYVLDRRLSYTLQPSVRDREDEIEQSLQYEVANTLLFTQSQLRTLSLSLVGRFRDLGRGQGLRIVDGNLLDDEAGLPTALTAATGAIGLDATWGRLDDPLRAREGFVLRPSATVAAGDVTFGRGRISATALRPIGGRSGLVARVTAGAIGPLGATDADAADDYVLLRDQLFYAGGTADVRGWAGTRLGPKTISVTPPTEGDEVFDPTDVTSRGDVNYVGIGGRAKVSASVQLNLPLPLGPQWGAQVFVDAGQVFAPSNVPSETLLRATGAPADSALADLIDGEGGLRIGTGAGIQYLSPVGFISFGLGVKVNPSYFDLRSAARVYCGDSILADEPSCGDSTEADDGGVIGYLDARQNGSDFSPDLIPEREPFGGLLSFLNVLFGRGQLYISIGQTF
ncbi:MAG: BamA/TamA family outer membrane protein [Bacteroidota bacterium]